MQTKLMSFLESLINIFIGYFVCIILQIIIFPYFGIKISVEKNFIISGIFTIFSIIRSYFIRRIFNNIKKSLYIQNGSARLRES